MIRLRKPKKDDGAIYLMIIRELVPQSQTKIPKRELTPRAIIRRLNRNMTYVWAKGDRKPMGFISFKTERGTLKIDMIAVSSREQGRGVGSELLLAAERYGIGRRCREALLFVDDTNVRAQKFYQSKGYQLVQYVADARCYLLSKALSYDKPPSRWLAWFH